MDDDDADDNVGRVLQHDAADTADTVSNGYSHHHNAAAHNTIDWEKDLHQGCCNDCVDDNGTLALFMTVGGEIAFESNGMCWIFSSNDIECNYNDEYVDNDGILEEEDDVDDYKGGWYTVYVTGMYLKLNDAVIDAWCY